MAKNEKAGYSPSALFPSIYVLVSQLFAPFLPSGPTGAVIGVQASNSVKTTST